MPDEVIEQAGETTTTTTDAQPVTDTDKTGEARFTQADVERIVKERVKREQDKASAAAEKARKEAEESALAKNAEWQTLAEKREKELAELAPFREKAERYEAALKAQLEEARKGLTGAALKLLDRLDPAEQLEFIAANRAELAPEKSNPNGVGSNPNSSNGKNLSSEEREKLRQQDRKNFSGFFR